MPLASPSYIYFDPNEASPSGNVVATRDALVSYISTTLGNNIGAAGANCVLHIRQCANATLSNSIDFTVISGQDADHQILWYPWNRSTSQYNHQVYTLAITGSFKTWFNTNSSSRVQFRGLKVNGSNEGTNIFCKMYDGTIISNSYFYNWTNTDRGVLNYLDGGSPGYVVRCLFKNSSAAGTAIKGSAFRSVRLQNCVIVNFTTGIDLENNTTQYIYNNVVFGCTTNYYRIPASPTGCGFNTGQSGNTIPDSVGGGSSYVISDIATHFPNHASNDYSLNSNSALRAGNAGFPNAADNKKSLQIVFPDNTLAEHIDWNGDTLPTSGQWDIGYDQYVTPITGTRWVLPSSNTLISTRTLEKEGDAGTTIQFSAISNGTDLDDLVIPLGVTATWDSYDNRRGMGFEVSGTLIISNSSNTTGRIFQGFKTKKMVIKATGKVNITGALIDLGVFDSANVSNGTAWTNAWTTTKDDTNKYAEPAALCIGPNSSSVVKYLNRGNLSTALKTDATHGLFFDFDETTGAITWPYHQPASGDHVYCANLMMHSKNGQDTNALSYGIDTFAGGELDAELCYFTGSMNAENASKLHLTNCGSLQAPTVKNCTNVALDGLCVGLSSANAGVNSSQFKITGLINEQSIGTVTVARPDTGVLIEDIFNITLSLRCQMTNAQAASNQPLYLSSSTGPTPSLTFASLTLIGGGFRCDAKALNNLTISNLYHSDDCFSGGGQGGQQPIIYVGAVGGQVMRIDNLNLLANGAGTAKEILFLQNYIDFNLSNVNYPATIKAVANLQACKDGVIDGVIINSFTGQDIAGSSILGLKCYNGYCLNNSNGVDAYAHTINSRSIDKRNWMYQLASHYSTWTTALANTNFLELNKRNASSAWDGVLVFNFFKTSNPIFNLSGGAVSDNDTGVFLQSVNDAVEYEIAGLKTGGQTAIFANTAPAKVGAGNVANFAFEYKLDKGSGYSSYASMTAGNLSAESFSGVTEFNIKIRVTCPSGQASPTNKIQQVILATVPRPDLIRYALDYKTLTLSGLSVGSDVLIMSTANPDGSGNNVLKTFDSISGTEIEYVYPYSVSQFINIAVYKYGYKPILLKNFELPSVDTAIPINQVLDRSTE